MGNLNILNAMPEIANPIVTAAAGSKAANVPAITARNLSIFFGGKKVLLTAAELLVGLDTEVPRHLLEDLLHLADGVR